MNQVLATRMVFRALHGKRKNVGNIKELFKNTYAVGPTMKYYTTIKTLKYFFLNKGWIYNGIWILNISLAFYKIF